MQKRYQKNLRKISKNQEIHNAGDTETPIIPNDYLLSPVAGVKEEDILTELILQESLINNYQPISQINSSITNHQDSVSDDKETSSPMETSGDQIT